MASAVEKGLKFEESVLEFINDCGMKAIRTNKSNEYDPDCYKAGFDGGVDIIAEFETASIFNKSAVFYIQCKCHEAALSKQAVCEVYAGMHARKVNLSNSYAVVFTTSDISQETRQYAKSLEVELFTKTEFSIVQNSMSGMPVEYDNYSTFMKSLLYLITKNTVWLNSLPYTPNNIFSSNTTEEYLKKCKVDFDRAQSYLDSAKALERKAEQERQKALDIQRVTVFRSLQHETSTPPKEDG